LLEQYCRLQGSSNSSSNVACLVKSSLRRHILCNLCAGDITVVKPAQQELAEHCLCPSGGWPTASDETVQCNKQRLEVTESACAGIYCVYMSFVQQQEGFQLNSTRMPYHQQ
jgi:hypothetical protein